MRTFDQNGVELLEENVDLTKGRLVKDQLFVTHHEAVEAVEEQGHWITVAEYPNGGKDVEWVVDVAGVEASDAWDEYEDILRYILYTESELDEISKIEENTPEYRISQLEEALELLLSGVTE